MSVSPAPDAAASADRGFFSSIFGGSSVSIKSNYQRKSLTMTQTLTLDGTIAIFDAKSGDLNDLEPAIKANLDKYLAVIDIGQPFQKVQVAAKTNVKWEDETLTDGVTIIKLHDPISSIQLEVGYPDFTNPLGADGKPNPQFRGEGFHYVIGHKDQNRPSEPTLWNNKDNGQEIVNVAFLKLDKPIPGWDVDEVIYRKTIVYDPSDPRVDLSGGGSTFVKEERTKSHVPVITPDEVGYVCVTFMTKQTLPEAISLVLHCKIGNRTDTLEISKANQKNILWEIFSDKFINETSASYEIEVTVVGPQFTDDEIFYKSPAPISFPLPTGRTKFTSVVLDLPTTPPDKVDTINKHIKDFAKTP